ncbi:MAG: biotin transporter BioY [Alphaproteobacteria bacterium]|nr:biotin transporter BioY [Alphaproteobacteria bacterium]
MQPTLAETLWPDASSPTVMRVVRNVILAIVGSLFVALSAQVVVPLWPVPVTGQTFAVLVVGMAFGWRLGGATLILYLIEGAVFNLPVFAKGAAGFAALAAPSGGFIVGFIFAAVIIGYLAELGWDRNVWLAAAAMLIGNIVLYIPGLIWLTMFYAGPGAQSIAATGANTAMSAAIAGGLMPFLVGDALKLALAAVLFPVAWRLFSKER